MQLQERINAFATLGRFLAQFATESAEKQVEIPHNQRYFPQMQEVLKSASAANGWFTEYNLRFTLKNWSEALTSTNLTEWLTAYDIPKEVTPKRVAIVMAGNIPLVGFHDFLCVLLAGHSAVVKLSSNDNVLLPFLTAYLAELSPGFSSRIEITTKQLPEFDAVIATGSNNTSLYFEHYFGKYPHIIRKNRNSVAVLDGTESQAQLTQLADDIFRYFGLGCRNVSKLFVPDDYGWDTFFNGMFSWKDVINHHKYINNYDYNKAVYLMGNHNLLDNEFLLLKEDNGFSSPIAVVFFQTYGDTAELQGILAENEENIQCIVGNNHIPFGNAQTPRLDDYADGVDTMSFLLGLS